MNLLKRKIRLFSPVNGESISISEVKDEVFANKLIGDGIAFKLYEDMIYSPCTGEITAIASTKHAIGIRGKNGIEILLHVGMDTVSLEGEGFEVLTEVEAKVEPGDPLIKFDEAFLKSKEMDTLTMIVVTNPGDFQPEQFLTNKEVKAANDPIMVYKK